MCTYRTGRSSEHCQAQIQSSILTSSHICSHRVDELSAEAAKASGASVASVLCGDFNATPGSGLYRYVTEGKLDLKGEDRRVLSGEHLFIVRSGEHPFIVRSGGCCEHPISVG